MANYIQNLKEENEKLKAELEKIQEAKAKVFDQIEDNDRNGSDSFNNEEVTIYLGSKSEPIHAETLSRKKAFDRLYEYYDKFNKPTDRSVIKEMNIGGEVRKVNDATVYIRKTYTDLISKQQITLIRDTHLWNAVYSKLNQPRCTVELISRNEFIDWYNDKVKEDIKGDKQFMDLQRQRARQELQKEIDVYNPLIKEKE